MERERGGKSKGEKTIFNEREKKRVRERIREKSHKKVNTRRWGFLGVILGAGYHSYHT